ncbi:hypothetical protein DL767_005267 [Monosporascus sp. MG133]|nr:hypothetical protein DL767_005267 [Monosporascus sp. MG133]
MGASASIFSISCDPANVNQPDRNRFAALNIVLKITTEPFVNLDANEMPGTTAVASSAPAPVAKGAKGKAKADVTGKTDDGKWSLEETIKLLFLVMQHENPELAVQGWKDIGEKVQKVFDGKYSTEAARKRFHNVRRAYVDEFPLPDKQDGPPTDTQTTPKGKAKAAAPKSRKRSAAVAAAAAASGVQDSNDADDETAGEGRAPKRVKTEKQPAAAPTKEEAQKGDTTEEDAATATIEQEKQEKPAAAKPKPKRKAPAKKTKPEKQADDGEADASEKPRPKAKRTPAKPRAKKAESTLDPKLEEVKPKEDKPSPVDEADGANGPAQDGDDKV